MLQTFSQEQYIANSDLNDSESTVYFEMKNNSKIKDKTLDFVAEWKAFPFLSN